MWRWITYTRTQTHVTQTHSLHKNSKRHRSKRSLQRSYLSHKTCLSVGFLSAPTDTKQPQQKPINLSPLSRGSWVWLSTNGHEGRNRSREEEEERKTTTQGSLRTSLGRELWEGYHDIALPPTPRPLSFLSSSSTLSNSLSVPLSLVFFLSVFLCVSRTQSRSPH